MAEPEFALAIRPGHPDFLDLPWAHPLTAWPRVCARVEELPRGLSRHPVVFINYDGVLYALKELAPGRARQEYDLLFTRSGLAHYQASLLDAMADPEPHPRAERAGLLRG